MPPPGQGAAGTPAAAAAAMPAPGAASTSAVPGAVHVTTTTTATHLQPASGELICSGSVVFLMTFFGWQLDGRPSAILVRLSYRSSVPVCTAVDAAARAGVLLCVLRVLAQVWWQAVPTLPGAWGLWVVCILLRGGGCSRWSGRHRLSTMFSTSAPCTSVCQCCTDPATGAQCCEPPCLTVKVLALYVYMLVW
jgi:hypothetical protein